jgi:peptide/nickel transport system substrate-binding protein
MDISELEKEVIKKRNYESLLFGEVLTLIPDPFPFWHSTQKKDPGLNLTSYQNTKVDKLLEEIRQTLDDKARKEKLGNFQNLLISDSPAVFLYNPDFLYLVSDEIKGLDGKIIADPSKRFSNIENWYIKIKRVWE